MLIYSTRLHSRYRKGDRINYLNAVNVTFFHEVTNLQKTNTSSTCNRMPSNISQPIVSRAFGSAAGKKQRHLQRNLPRRPLLASGHAPTPAADITNAWRVNSISLHPTHKGNTVFTANLYIPPYTMNNYIKPSTQN